MRCTDFVPPQSGIAKAWGRGQRSIRRGLLGTRALARTWYRGFVGAAARAGDRERRTEARERRRAVKDVEGEGEALQRPGWRRRRDV